MYNFLSIIFGILAFVLVSFNFSQKAISPQKMGLFLASSISSCMISILMQLLEVNRRVIAKDWSAIMDTIGSSVWVSAALAVIIILLNFVSLLLFSKNENI